MIVREGDDLKLKKAWGGYEPGTVLTVREVRRDGMVFLSDGEVKLAAGWSVDRLDSYFDLASPSVDGSTNPKAAVGRAKPPLHAIPPSALLWLGLGMEDGEKKYGLTNWRSRPVDAATYYDAAFRHLLSWWDGEREATDSKVHHLGHVMACCAIIIDAEAQGTLVDNRPDVAGMAARLIEEMATARKKDS